MKDWISKVKFSSLLMFPPPPKKYFFPPKSFNLGGGESQRKYIPQHLNEYCMNWLE